ncbi:MAG: AAA family ATPase, partial [Phaeodactylibacter sp.]|nr:AAA family ATPase [Phaeodactylibacter sp.]
IVLLDEIEKAHHDTFNILLQVLDDGRLTDNKGRVANFRNTIIIMTSNMGAETILENFEDLAELPEEKHQEIIEATKDEVFDLLKEQLRPEFLNRIDEQIMFLPLTREEIKQIMRLLLRKVDKMLGRQSLVLRLSPAAEDLLADLGYDPQFGARPMKRVLQKELVNELSKLVLAGTFTAGDTIYVDEKDDELTFSKEPFKGAPAAPKKEKAAAPKKEASKEKEEQKASEERKRQLEELQKATKDVEDAVKEVKKGKEDK